ncbi:uncharacterized protein SPSK_02831 [Sporothrix schenckii 1099-18]|uniref:Uncharacterized protein n=1 Tax=Sporothrix schenckii 1099-18 TaxID=1397361 RepID=A0A0F2MAQ4_SPOSC|nr:uncharacterized protein SPSK_02831 [Sporothrix schenckii 1099-18]KJR86159.1 hypothetical protein SPSK_02831 [Sporothrix schenckii 1099-18]
MREGRRNTDGEDEMRNLAKDRSNRSGGNSHRRGVRRYVERQITGKAAFKGVQRSSKFGQTEEKREKRKREREQQTVGRCAGHAEDHRRGGYTGLHAIDNVIRAVQHMAQQVERGEVAVEDGTRRSNRQ